jgi:hypothetical protein
MRFVGWLRRYQVFHSHTNDAYSCIPSYGASIPTRCTAQARSTSGARLQEVQAGVDRVSGRAPRLFAHWGWTRELAGLR